MALKILLGADHRGFKLKEEIKPWLIGLDHEVLDMGAKIFNSEDDYVDFAIVASTTAAPFPKFFL